MSELLLARRNAGSLPSGFYVYLYRKPCGTPFYAGKGNGDRALHHLAEAKKECSADRNLLKLNTIRKIVRSGAAPTIQIVEDGLGEETSFELESFLISEIGRVDLGTGTLANMTDGGEGLSGLIRDLSGENNPNFGKRGEDSIWWGRTHTEETKTKQPSSQKGKVMTEAHKMAMRKPKSEQGRANMLRARLETSYRPSEETKRKTSMAMKGRPSPMKGKTQTAEARKKMSDARKGIPKQKRTCEHCNRGIAVNVFGRFHGDNCKSKDAHV